MEKLHNLLDSLASPFKPYATWLLRIGLGVSFFLHGFGKLPLDSTGWLASNLGYTTALMVAWGELLAGIVILLGGFLPKTAGSLLTRLSGGAVGIIMISAIILVHLDWISSGKIFTSEQIFLLVLGVYFAIKGNQNV